MLLKSQMKPIVMLVSTLFATNYSIAGSPVEEDLYVERGNIQVTKIVKTNPMGGTTIEYVKTKIDSHAQESTKTPVKKQLAKQGNVRKEVEVKTINNQKSSNVAGTPLYIEDGNIQVSQKITSNPMGGQSIEYAKTKVALEKVVEKKEIGQVAKSESVEETIKPNVANKVAMVEQSATVHGDTNSQVISDFPVHQSKLVVQTESPTGREKRLLAEIKARKQADQKLNRAIRITPEDNLMLSPNETAVDIKKTKQKRPSRKLRRSQRAEKTMIGKLEFNQANMRDVTRALADISGLNFVATDEAAKKDITVFLQNISVKNALEAITKNAGLWYRQDKDSGTFRIMSTKEYQKDLVVYREDVTKVYRLHQPNPMIVATAIRDLYGDRVLLSFGTQFDDFFTGQFNSGGGGNIGGQNGGNRGGGGFNGGGGRGQNSLRNGITSGIAGNNGGGNFGGLGGFGGNQQRKFDEKKFGANATGAITENLTVDQLKKIESAVNSGGNQLDGGALRGVTKAQQPIYVTVNNQQNMVILRTSDTIAVSEIDALIKEIDQPTPQVLLEMQILEVDVGDAYTQLFSFGALSSNGKHSFTGREDLNAADTGKFVYTFIDDLINTKLEILEETNKARIVSSPILLASNNRTSRLFVGEERLLVRGATLTDATFNQNGGQLTPSRITYETEIRNIGNTLNITPKINADNTVTLGIFQDASTVNEGAVDFPPLVNNGVVVNIALDTVQTSNIEGVVVAKDGLTVAIGGLINVTKSKRNSKIPVLGDLPYIGGLFNDRIESQNRSEMILLITPHIMYESTETDDRTRDVVEPISVQEW